MFSSCIRKIISYIQLFNHKLYLCNCGVVMATNTQNKSSTMVGDVNSIK